MMRVINSIQLMLLFSSMPFIITWVKDAEFYAHNVLFWVLIAVYVWSFGAMCVLLADGLKD